ncbi:unnamed protein product [Cylindrotheca closterium]|uniref:Cathepsin X n=1 Tax=Cylindrotheca closterium TaxID=2856 RepID=A0AAD2CGL6_9STRA|nr:unnamed protein product [Cylindrotheca closterium]
MLFLSLSLYLLVAHSVSSLKLRASNEYSFEQYVKDFDKEYSSDEEYKQREGVFLQNLAHILDHNSNRDSSQHYKDINHFSDKLDNELPLGYDKSSHPAWSSDTAVERRTLSTFEAVDLKKLPKSVDWRTNGRVTTAVKNQLHCGSCWAFATTACMESHVAIQTGKLFTLSVQELVSCMPNPNQCGGTGGCAGATAELGFDFIAKHGMVDEWSFGYQSGHGEQVNCTIMDDHDSKEHHIRGEKSTKIKGSVASVVGFSNLPTNKYDSLLAAVALVGPVAISVSATGWGLYHGGIYDDSTSKNRDINHAVVLEGYGTDEETGQDYWLVRNSWGPMWGEDGYIRLKRTDPSFLDDPASDCKMDVTPTDGVACTKDDSGNDIVPKAVSVCGTSGILFDTVVPIGAHLA